MSVINLGALSDEDAKKISLIDNGRYGEDDAFRLSELLSSLGDIDDLSTYMPYTDKSLESLFANSSIEIDDSEVDEEELAEETPTEKPVRTHVEKRLKEPIEDSGKSQKIIERIRTFT